MAQRVAPVGAPYPSRLRGLAPKVADGSPRHLPDAPRLPACRVGRDLAGVRDARRPGQGALRGFEQLRGLAHRSREWTQERLAEHRPQIEAFEKLCADLGEAPADVALAWMLANPVVTAPIVGPRTLEQLEGVMRALEVALDEATRKRLDEIFPGPGGEAPEAFSW